MDFFNAIETKNFNLVKTLLECGIDPNILNKQNLTPLHLAIEKSAYDIVKLLLENGANVNDQSNITKVTPLLRAILTHTSEEIKEKYFKFGFKTNKEIYETSISIIQLLLEYDAIYYPITTRQSNNKIINFIENFILKKKIKNLWEQYNDFFMLYIEWLPFELIEDLSALFS